MHCRTEENFSGGSDSSDVRFDKLDQLRVFIGRNLEGEDPELLRTRKQSERTRARSRASFFDSQVCWFGSQEHLVEAHYSSSCRSILSRKEYSIMTSSSYVSDDGMGFFKPIPVRLESKILWTLVRLWRKEPLLQKLVIS